ncbi:hypothetical protein [Roseobacter ponti]|uniref:Dual specificity protein phosphatase family protein n=1 Tax=Roseobacter ponti TaxID=1891787 RepID=A0A858SRT3_9RHOB|nr:hypothetical protein [Roseobacter ponti]QJF50321.1 dual specificity protein phosphatase family protein [Roseobacter ponti]
MRFLTAILVIVMSTSLAAAQDFTARSGGPSENEMMVRNVGDAPDGMAFFRPVLSGVLYRGGFSGGDKARTGLGSSQRQELCEDGFSQAFYADFGKNTDYSAASCAKGQMSYAAARSSRPASVMKAVHDVIKAPGKGPVLVHCMWGVHSSGALSAMALVQFCGWSEDRAKAYWNEARNGAPCSGGCDKWIDGKFERFKVDASLNISAAEQQAICPR